MSTPSASFVQYENWQVSLTAQDGMHFVAENGGFFSIFLPGLIRIGHISGRKQACVHDQFPPSDHSQAN
jgi:hypothetical protein